MKFYLKTKTHQTSYPQLWWCGDGFWTRRKDQAKAFDTREAAETEMRDCVKIEAVEPVSNQELEDA